MSKLFTSSVHGRFIVKAVASIGLILLVLGIPAAASANEVVTSTISNIRVRTNVVYVRFSGCPTYARIYLNSDYDRTMVAAALAAAASGQTVQVWFDRPTGCTVEEPMIEYLDVMY